MTTARFTSRDLDAFPDRHGWRYEIIDGELYVTKAPSSQHQFVCVRLTLALQPWSDKTGLGFLLYAPGVIFADDDDVIPDLVWVSKERLPAVIDAAGHLRGAPELVIEVLSPGSANERRDKGTKLQLYDRRDVPEYWIADWRARCVETYRREGGHLRLVATLFEADTLQSPLLPGFSCPVSDLFEGLSDFQA